MLIRNKLCLILSLCIPFSNITVGIGEEQFMNVHEEKSQIDFEMLREKRAEYHYNHGLHFYHGKKFYQARLQLRKALELNSKHKKADKLCKKVEAKITVIERKKQRKEKDKFYSTCFINGKKCFKEGNFQPAIEYFKKAFELKPSYSIRRWLRKALKEQEKVPPPEVKEPVKQEIREPEGEKPEEITEEEWGRNKVTSLEFIDTPIVDVLRALSKSYGLNIIPRSEVKGNVTINLQDVTLKEALDAILKVSEYRYEKAANIIFVEKLSRGIATEVFSLNHTKAGEINELFEKVLTEQGSVLVDERSNKLVITDIPEGLERARKLLDKLDAPIPQVMIEVVMLDVTISDLKQVGIKWEGTYSKEPLLRDPRRRMRFDEGKVKSDLGNPGSTEFPGIAFDIGTTLRHWSSVKLEVDALIKDHSAELLANPRIVTANGKEARVIIGEKVPYKEKTQTTTGTTETTKFIDVGITLRVTPQISENGYVNMVIHPEVSSVTELIDNQPRIDTREADTEITVKDGHTIIIGGLIKEKEDIKIGGIPILSKLPLIGILFRNEHRQKEKKELVIFVTPHIL